MPWRTLIAWLLVLPIAGWTVLRAFGLEEGYPLVPLLAYTPLAVAGGVAVFLLSLLLLRRRAPALVALVATLALAALVAPRVLGGPSGAEGADGPRLRVLTANLYQEPRAARSVVELIRRERPDVVALQEVTPRTAAALEAAGIDRLLPQRAREVLPGGAGSAVYARLPLDDVGRRGRSVTAVRLRPRGGPAVEVLSLHAMVPRREANMDQWRADLRALPPATPRGDVRILAGDFNATLDHAELRRVLDRGYEDAADAVGHGLRATWPSNRRLPPPVTIDHVLADERCGVRELEVIDVPGSDHRAVLAELVLPR